MHRYYITRRDERGLLDFPAYPVPKDIRAYGKNGLELPIAGSVFGYAHYEEQLNEDTVKHYGLVKGPIPAYDTISEATARRAKEMMSFDDYKTGSATNGYREMVDYASMLAEQKKQETDPMYHDKLDALLATYIHRLAANINQENSIGTRCPSIMIAGGSNFPVRKKEKQVEAYRKNAEDFNDVQEILNRMESVGRGGISADDPNAIEKLKIRLADLQKAQDTMKGVNAYYRKHGTVEGCDLLSQDALEKIKASMGCNWHMEDKPFASYALSNNSANIRRIKKRIEELEKKAQEDTPGDWDFESGDISGEVIFDKAENRIKLAFFNIPPEEARKELKANGFRWSPRNKVWQRQDTPNARRALNSISFLKPVEPED